MQLMCHAVPKPYSLNPKYSHASAVRNILDAAGVAAFIVPTLQRKAELEKKMQTCVVQVQCTWWTH